MALEVSLIGGGNNDCGDYAQLEGAGQPAAEVVTSPGCCGGDGLFAKSQPDMALLECSLLLRHTSVYV